jgi:cysteinyl-tRNA synthetase
MCLKVYDALRADRFAFQPVREGKVGMYICGMTVQDRPHVGHMRGAVVGDLVRRVMTYFGYDVTYLNNFTDVDDKIIDRANEEGADYRTIAQRNMDCYMSFVDLLGNRRATLYPKATEHMPEIQDLIACLVGKGVAYPAGGDVYFRVDRDPDYGKLSKRKIDELRSGSRIEVGDQKESPLDFALWKMAKEGEPYWDSPWGRGRPGWHIECSAMAMKYLGPSFDIHGGGIDLIFPHHENEIAQSEAATGQTFVNYWIQHGLLLLGGEKMSKSTKLFFLIEDVCQVAHPDTVRYYLLSTHFRSPIEFSEERLAEAGVALARLQATAAALCAAAGPPPRLASEPFPPEKIQDLEIRGVMEKFLEALQDDFNSARAIGNLFDLSRFLNRHLALPASGEKEATMREGQMVLHHLADLIGLNLLPINELVTPPDVMRLVEDRAEARRSKDWAKADLLRQDILARGFLVEDKGGKSEVRPCR